MFGFKKHFFCFVYLCFGSVASFAQSWTPAADVINTSTGDIPGQLQINQEGTPFFIYVDTAVSPFHIYSIEYSVEGDMWGNQLQIYPYDIMTDTYDVTFGFFSMNAAGQGICIFRRNDGMSFTGHLYASFFNGTEWSAPSLVPALGGSAGTFNDFKGQMNDNGTVLFSWTQVVGLNAQLAVSIYDGVSWSTPEILEDASGGPSRITNGINNSGQGFVAWVYNGDVKVALYESGTWGAAQVVSTGTADNSAFAINQNGVVSGVWKQGSEMLSQIYNGAWQPMPIPLGSGIGGFGNIAMNNDFQMAVANISSRIEVHNLDLNDIGAGWVMTFSHTTEPFYFAGVIDLNATGQGVVGFKSFNGVTRFNACVYDGGWCDTPTVFNSTGSFSYNAGVAINPLGGATKIIAAWELSSMVDSSYFFAEAPLPDPPFSVSGKIRYDEFALQTERVKQISWIASPSPEVSSYKVLKNGELLAVVESSSPLLYEDHRQPSTIALYGVIAVSSEGESDPISISL